MAKNNCNQKLFLGNDPLEGLFEAMFPGNVCLKMMVKACLYYRITLFQARSLHCFGKRSSRANVVVL